MRLQASFEYLLLIGGGVLAGLIVSSMLLSTTSSTATELNTQVHKYDVEINYASLHDDPPTIVYFTIEPAVGKPQDTFTVKCYAEDDIKLTSIRIEPDANTNLPVSKTCNCNGTSCECILQLSPPNGRFEAGEYIFKCTASDESHTVDAYAKFFVTAVKAVLELLWPPPNFVTGSENVTVKWRLYDPDNIIDEIIISWDEGNQVLSPKEDQYTISYSTNECQYCEGTNVTINNITVTARDKDAQGIINLAPVDYDVLGSQQPWIGILRVRTYNVMLRDPPKIIELNVLNASKQTLGRTDGTWEWRNSYGERNAMLRWKVQDKTVDINLTIFDQDIWKGLSCGGLGGVNLIIDWGDGSKNRYKIYQGQFQGGKYNIVVSHTYSSDGLYTVKFTLTDECNLTSHYYIKIFLDTTPPSITYSYYPSQNVRGGGTVTVTCHYHDSGIGLARIWISAQGQYKEENLYEFNNWGAPKDYSLSVTVNVSEESAVPVSCGAVDALGHGSKKLDYACADYHECDYAGERWCASTHYYWRCDTRTAGTCTYLVHRMYSCGSCYYNCWKWRCSIWGTCSYCCETDENGNCTDWCSYTCCKKWTEYCDVDGCSLWKICSNGECINPSGCYDRC